MPARSRSVTPPPLAPRIRRSRRSSSTPVARSTSTARSTPPTAIRSRVPAPAVRGRLSTPAPPSAQATRKPRTSGLVPTRPSAARGTGRFSPEATLPPRSTSMGSRSRKPAPTRFISLTTPSKTLAQSRSTRARWRSRSLLPPAAVPRSCSPTPPAPRSISVAKISRSVRCLAADPAAATSSIPARSPSDRPTRARSLPARSAVRVTSRKSAPARSRSRVPILLPDKRRLPPVLSNCLTIAPWPHPRSTATPATPARFSSRHRQCRPPSPPSGMRALKTGTGVLPISVIPTTSMVQRAGIIAQPPVLPGMPV